MRRVAVFVDAGYLWVQLSHIVHGSFTKKNRSSVLIDHPGMRQGLLDQVAIQFPDVNLLRIYWYDGPGPSGKTSGHCAIEELDDFKLKLGTRNMVGDQKAVDGLIIADMIAMAQSKAISDALLISGDADLTPGVAAAQALGIRVHLLTMGSSNATSPYLKAEVDFKAHWDDIAVKKFASANISNGSAQQAAVQSLASPTTAPIAQSATTTTTAWMDEVVASVFSKIKPEELQSLSGNSPIPKNLDRQLLRKGCQKAGAASLTEDQKRQLRTKLRSKFPPTQT